MNDNNTIRGEAKDFYESEIDISAEVQPIQNFYKIKSRLNDFYSSENKATFLDEIEKKMKAELQEHRDKAHGGNADASCIIEVKTERLLFYIRQEILTLPLIAHQKYIEPLNAIRSKVFISYSHLDKEFLNDIQRHFKPFMEKIDYWDDSRILPGQKWEDEIKKAVNETKVAILLVSTDFLGSKFIKNEEIPPLLRAAEKEGAVILIVILKPCLFEEFNDLNQFQALNSPSDPVIKMNYAEKEELYVNLVRQTKRYT